jgi:ligand-binding sensor domain-containing protein
MVLHQGGFDVKRILTVLAAFALLVPGVASAASGDWNIYVNASGINRITCVGDSIWCATRGGIVVFSLVDSSFVQHLDGLGFRSTDVSGVTRDDRGSVWASFTTSGIARIDRFGSDDPSVKLYSSTIDGLLSDSVTCVVAAGSDVYYGSRGGVAKFYDNLHSLEPVLSDSLEGVFVHDLLVRGDTLWVGCETGVARFLRGTFGYTMYRIGDVTSLCVHGGAVCAGGTSGVWRFDGSGWISLGQPGGLVPLAVAAGAGPLYSITVDKAFRLDGSSWTDITANMESMFSQTYTISSSFNVPKTIVVDSRGTLWLAGYESQIDRGAYLSAYLSNAWVNRAPVQLSQNGVVTLSLATGGGIWMSTRYFGISFRSNDDRWAVYSQMRTQSDPRGLSYFLNNIALLCDSQGYLWCSAWADLDRITINDPLDKGDDAWTHFALGTGTITANRFVRAAEDPAGNRWFLSDDEAGNQGLFGINIVSADGTSWLSINPNTVPQMAGGSVFDVAFAPGGVVFLALRGYGVQVWYTGGFDWAHLSDIATDGWSTIIRPEDLTSKELWSIERGDDDAVWVGTSAGLVRWKAGTIDSLTIKMNPGERGLIGAKVLDLEFDGARNLWVGTDLGLNKIAPDGTIEAFTSAEAWQGDLYPSSIISPLPSSVCQALKYDETTNFLWIGTTNGLARLDVTPARAREIPLSNMILYPNPIHISRGDNELKISRISGPVSIRVYTLDGELVHEADGVVDGGRAWDILTLNGFKVRSGIYLVKVSAGSQSEVRKIAVIR